MEARIESVNYVGSGVYRPVGFETDHVRIQEDVIDTVCYLTYGFREVAGGPPEFKLAGTGFFVRVNSEIQGQWFNFLVTAKHLIDAAKGRSIGFLVNGNDGTIKHYAFGAMQFYQHPTDNAADVAIHYVQLTGDMDVKTIPLEALLEKDDLVKKGIGVGDEIFIVGLFAKAPGVSRNVPIVRHGNLAMIPRDKLRTRLYGDADVYLFEARSIGGISGSPVFVRETLDVNVNRLDGATARLSGLAGRHCLGLVHGHWDIGVEKMNEALLDIDQGDKGVNLGIGIVTPAYKILETLKHPEMVEKMRKAEDKFRSENLAKLDSVEDNIEDPSVFTREDFEGALKKVSKKIQPSQSDEGKSKT